MHICLARSFAKAAMHDQLQSFKRWGVMGDWSSCYTTFSTEYQDAQLDVFYKLFTKVFFINYRPDKTKPLYV